MLGTVIGVSATSEDATGSPLGGLRSPGRTIVWARPSRVTRPNPSSTRYIHRDLAAPIRTDCPTAMCVYVEAASPTR